MRNLRLMTFLLTISILLRLVYLFTIPLGKAPDELYHFERIYYTSIRLRFPDEILFHRIDYQNSTYPSPGGYYVLNALLLSPFLKLPLLPTITAFEHYGHVLRFINLVISTVTLGLSTRMIWKLFPSSAVFILLLLYFFPQWTSSSTYISSDPLFLLLLTILLSVLVNVVMKPFRPWYALLLSLWSSLAILTKPLAPLVVFGVLAGIFSSSRWRKDRHAALFIYLAGTTLLTGWWYVNNYFSTGSFLASPEVRAVVTGYTQPFSFPYYFFGVGWWTAQTFVLSLGPTNNVRLVEVFYPLFWMFIAVLLTQYVKKPVRDSLLSKKPQKKVLIILTAMTFFAVIQFIIVNTTLSFQPQGRYLYPLVLLFPIVVGHSLSYLTPDRTKPYLLVGTVAVLLLFNFWGLRCMQSQSKGCAYYRVVLPVWQDPLTLR